MKISITFPILLFILCQCSNPTYTEAYSNELPELTCHFEGQDLKCLGSFYNNFVYIDPSEDPELKDGYVVSVHTAREDYIILFKDVSKW